ncbi:MAG: hypothetical protein ACUVTD_01105 [Nitrososphaerales archaeon]
MRYRENAKLFNVKSEKSVAQKMKRLGISRRSLFGALKLAWVTWRKHG